MLVMCHQINVGNLSLLQVDTVSVSSAIDTLSDTCTITVPGSVIGISEAIEKSLKRGDAVAVRLGYNDALHTEFTGYVRTIHNTTLLKIECEDASFLFRKPVKDKSFKKTTVLEVLTYTLKQINAQLPAAEQIKLITDLKGMQYDSFTIVASTGLMVLEKIKEQFGIAIYCRTAAKANELHCHLQFTQKRGAVTYDFSRNIERKSALEWVKASDRKVQIKLVGKNKKGDNVEVETGEKGGDSLTIKRPTVSDKKTLLNMAKQMLKTHTYDGYKGSIRGWLEPVCEIGYTATIVDSEYPDRNGNYYVKSVKTEYSRAGGVRTVELGIKLSSTSGMAVNTKADYLDYE